MKKTIQLLSFMLVTTLFSQTKGDNFRKEGDLEKAINAYKSEYTKNKLNSNNTYNLACAYALTYQKDSAFHYLNIALKNDTRLWALADNDLLTLTNDKRWKEVEKNQFVRFEAKNGKLKKAKLCKTVTPFNYERSSIRLSIRYGKTFL